MKLFTKKKIIAGLFVATLLATGLLSLLQTNGPLQTQSATQEDIARMVKPSVVRIVQRVKGKYSIPEIDINLSTLESSIKSGQRSPMLDLDEFITGSGFVINPDGYILTNSHVVSEETIKYDLIGSALNQALEETTRNLPRTALNQLLKEEKDIEAFAQRTFALMSEASSFDIQSEVVVLNPSSDKEDVEDLFRLGFPAEIINVNHDFFQNERDVALIRINQTNLPAVPLSAEAEPAIGSKIYIFGFPATADFNKKNPLEATFTQGIVSASKHAESKEFKVYQTDAKISQGSSGGPMFNERGEVIGIITFQTGEILRQAGDNFAFAIPINLANPILREHKVTPKTGNYRIYFQEGLQLYQVGKCQESLKMFASARQSNFYFTPEKYTSFYVQSCQTRIDTGMSTDTIWQQILSRTKQVNSFAWFIVMGRIILITAAAYVIWLILRRIKKDEQSILELEERISENQRTPSDFGTPLPLPEEGLYRLGKGRDEPHEHLLQYISEARLVGMSESLIRNDLKTAGWTDEHIDQAIHN